MKRKFLSFTLALSIICVPMTSFADNDELEKAAMEIPPLSTIVTSSSTNSEISPQEVSYFYDYTESNRYTSKGNAVRVSDTLTTGAGGGVLTLTKGTSTTISWGISANAEIKKAITSGVSFGIQHERSTQMGYTLNVPPNKKAYMVAIPVYNVSLGKLRTYQGQILRSTQSITVTSPSHYEYALRYE